jgi:hypothetical protein
VTVQQLIDRLRELPPDEEVGVTHVDGSSVALLGVWFAGDNPACVADPDEFRVSIQGDL